jgi:hypothetical protein
MTLAELVTEMSREYPTTVEVNTRVAFLNQALLEMEDYFDNFALATFTTVADQDEYSFPTGIEDISQIVSFGVSNKATPSDRYDYTQYHPSTFLDYSQNGNCYYQLTNSAGTKKLILYPVPTVTGNKVSITYKKHFTTLAWTSNTLSPEFDSRYHILLVYYANHMIATTGHSPDTMQADMFMQKWLSGLQDVIEKKAKESVTHPKKRRDNQQWHGGKIHTSGTTVVVP